MYRPVVSQRGFLFCILVLFPGVKEFSISVCRARFEILRGRTRRFFPKRISFVAVCSFLHVPFLFHISHVGFQCCVVSGSFGCGISLFFGLTG